MMQPDARNDGSLAKLMQHRYRGRLLEWTADYLEGLSLAEISERNDSARVQSFTLKTYRACIGLVCDAIEEADPDRTVLPLLLRRPDLFCSAVTLSRKGFTMQDILTLPRPAISNRARRIGWGTITTIRSLVNAGARAA